MLDTSDGGIKRRPPNRCRSASEMMAERAQLSSRLVSHMRSLHIRPRRHLTALAVALWGGAAAVDWQVNWRVADNELPVLHRLAIIYLMLPVMIWLLGWFHWWLGIPATVLLGLGLWKAISGSWQPVVRLVMPLLLLVVTLARIMLSVIGGLFDFNTGEWLGIPAMALLVFALWKAMSGASSRSSIRPMTLALLLVAAGWVMLTAAGGLSDIDNFDWPKHRATLLDLGRYSWPTYLPMHLHYLFADAEPSNPLLRYYLGYYIVPALASRWFGPAALGWAVPLWTWLGVALILLLFVRSYLAGRPFLQ